MYPTPAQEEQMLLHCAHARYVWNLAVEQHSHWRRWRRSAPGFAEQCRRGAGHGRGHRRRPGRHDHRRPLRRTEAERLAAHFRLSEATVKTHVARILAKLRLRDRAQAVVVAYETGLIVPGTAEGPPAAPEG